MTSEWYQLDGTVLTKNATANGHNNVLKWMRQNSILFNKSDVYYIDLYDVILKKTYEINYFAYFL